MAIIQGNAKQGSTRGFYPKVINGSLRFNDGDTPYLSWTPESAGNRKTWTFSFWVKRATIGQTHSILSAQNGSGVSYLGFINDTFRFLWNGGGANYSDTTMVFRDPSAWYHIVAVWDTVSGGQGYKVYVNGESVAVSTSSPTTNTETGINDTVAQKISSYVNLYYMDGYLANVHFIDGQALTADDFGETKNGVWVAKDYAGTFGTNGFYLTFEDDTQVEAFNTVLYRGNGGTQSITGTGFQPDLVWIKERTSTSSHGLFDSVRGAGKALYSNLTASEENYPSLYLKSFDTDGFTVGSNAQFNESSQNYVAWCWKAGDSNVSNTDGTITSTVRANPTYGFSIVSYTGTGSAGTVGHGLSTAPSMMIVKCRNNANAWRVYTSALGETKYLTLNAADASGTASSLWNDTAPTSSVFSVGTDNDTNGSTRTYIAYCWSETTGYSKFGSYSGDNTTDGSNETTVGFKPAFVIIKNTGSGENWNIYDNTRFTDGDGYIEGNLFASSSSAEVTTAPIEFTATGFAPRASGGGVNASGSTYIYAAFADTREAAFWLDQSGNDNDWQPVNLDHNDTVADSPTNNFATLNPLDAGTASVFADGNLRYSHSSNAWSGAKSTFAVSSGKWYFEATLSFTTQSASNIGICLSTNTANTDGNTSGSYIYSSDGTTYFNGSSSTGNASYTNGDTIGVAFDMDAGTLTFYKNGSVQPTTASSLSGEFTPFVSLYYGSDTAWTVNFGQQPFKYDPPA